MSLRRLAAVAFAVGAIAGSHAPSAAASPDQEAVFMDDNELVFGSEAGVDSAVSTMRDLGADRLRASVFWREVAPSPTSHTRPDFGPMGAADPAAYGDAAWKRYDQIVDAARRHGLEVYFTITGPAPFWASSQPAREEPMLEPSPSEFRQFATAVGRRYPGVRMWSIWNEPNQPGWLRPQTRRGVPTSPRLYRALQDAGYAALADSGHGNDTYLLGETAPRGAVKVTHVSPMRPLLFIRELYCVDARLRPYSGRRAAARGCPTNAAGRRNFASEHPGLFRASGFAHHPYALEVRPSTPERTRDSVTMSVLGRLTRTLDLIARRYRKPGGLPLWLTEYGYQTNPPDPIVGTSWRRQAAYLAEAEDIAFRSPRVRALAQFLLVDDGPNTKVAPSNPRYWGSTFQSGLVTKQGARKPAFEGYRRPIHVSRRGRRRLRVFGALRPAPNGAVLSAQVEFKPRRGGGWRTIRTVKTSNPRNYLVAFVRSPGPGFWRLAWADPGGGSSHSRAVYAR